MPDKLSVRLWVDPPEGTHNLNYTIKLTQRFARKGHAIYLDYHFSDTWADPQKQFTPAAWPTELPALSHTLRAYVSSTLRAFADARTAPARQATRSGSARSSKWSVRSRWGSDREWRV